MFSNKGYNHSTHEYQALPDTEDRGMFQEPRGVCPAHHAAEEKPRNRLRHVGEAIVFLFAIAVGFAAGALSMRRTSHPNRSSSLPDTAPRIPIPTIQREFVYSSPFSKEPPRGPDAGNASEPIWDALVPSR